MEPKLVVAGIDVHKKMLMVVVVDEDHPQQALAERKFGTNGKELKHLAAWLGSHAVSLVVMESTALYWRPVWLALEEQYALHLAQAQSKCGAARSEIGLHRRATVGAAIPGSGAEAELRTGCRAADLAGCAS